MRRDVEEAGVYDWKNVASENVETLNEQNKTLNKFN